MLKTDERSAARSKTDEADAELLWATSEHQRQHSGAGYAAQPTAGPNAAATSADTDENGRVCVDGLGAYALLLKPIGAPAAVPECRRYERRY